MTDEEKKTIADAIDRLVSMAKLSVYKFLCSIEDSVSVQTKGAPCAVPTQEQRDAAMEEARRDIANGLHNAMATEHPSQVPYHDGPLPSVGTCFCVTRKTKKEPGPRLQGTRPNPPLDPFEAREYMASYDEFVSTPKADPPYPVFPEQRKRDHDMWIVAYASRNPFRVFPAAMTEREIIGRVRDELGLLPGDQIYLTLECPDSSGGCFASRKVTSR